MTITFYNYANASNKLDKSASLSGGTPITGEQIDSIQDLENPVIVIQSASTPTYNYCYIPAYNRYYFIQRVTWLGGQAFELQLHVDVLYTYKTPILGLYGTARYSNKGTPANVDPRISFDSNADVSITNLTLTETPWYVIRYYADYVPGDSLDVPRSIRVAFMEESVFDSFLQKYKALGAADRITVGNSIIDVSYVHYINYADITAYLHPQKVLNFVTNSESLLNNPTIVTASITLEATETAYIVENIEDADNIGYFQLTLGINTGNGYFWEYDDDYIISLPFIGDFKFNMRNFTRTAVTNVYLRISYEPYENNYVVVPVLERSGGVKTPFIGFMQSFPVNTTVPFKTDTAYTNMGLERLKAGVSVAGGVIAGVATGNPVAAALTIPTAITGFEQSKIRDATQYQLKGRTGGAAAYTSIVGAGIVVITQISQNPRAGYLDLWSDRGYPDGAYRIISSLSGYAEFDDVNMVGFSTATRNEVQEIETILKTGVIV